MEPPSQRRIEQRDRAVSSVHRAEDMEIGGQGEFFAGIGKGHSHLVGPSLSFVLFQKRDQFTQHLGNVGAVDFIDYQNMSKISLTVACVFCDFPENSRSGNQAENAGASRIGTQSLDEILVPVGFVEGYEFHTFFIAQLPEPVSDFPIFQIIRSVADFNAAPSRTISLSSARRAV